MIINAVKGFFVGMALIVPGLSASVLAIIFGIYEKGLYAVANFIKAPIAHGKFILPIAIGGGIGVLVGARLVISLTMRFPAFTYLFFCGLVAGSLPLVLSKFKQSPFKPFYLLYIAAAFIIVLAFGTASIEDAHVVRYYIGGVSDFFTLVIVGLVSVSMMAVPGISGSIIVIVMGHFGTIYNALSETVTFLYHLLSLRWMAAWESFATVFVLAPFAIGTFIGFVTAAKIMTYLLSRYETAVYYFVAGALLGTIGILFNMGVANNIPHDSASLAVFIIAGLGSVASGVFCTLFLGKK